MYYPELALKEYAPEIFASLRHHIGVATLEMYNSVLDRRNLKSFNVNPRNQGGKSQAFLYTTTDEKLVIKTMTPAERKFFLRKMLGNYYNHLITNQSSLIVRILGVFTLYPFKVNIIIMENVIPNKSSAIIFDLKGSSAGRTSIVDDSTSSLQGLILKDNNFKEFPQRLIVDESLKNDLISSVHADTSLFRSLDVMDYSLILAFYPKDLTPNIKSRYLRYSSEGSLFALGIIDLFQEYTLKKATEKTFKTVFKNKKQDISVASPNKYAKRFCKFFPSIFELN